MFKVKYADSTDKQDIIDFNIAMALETEDLELDSDLLAKGVQAVLDDPGKGRYLKVSVDDITVGSLMITLEWSDWRNRNVAWIQSLYVKSEYRNQGAFKHMFQFLEDECRQGVYAGIRLYVDRRNEPASRVYSRLGMNKEHYEMFEKMFTQY